nr:hypothetical protein [Kitasatospora sp. MBT66]
MLCPLPRTRLRYTGWPEPHVRLCDTPRPNCPDCEGAGGWDEDYGDYYTGEYAGTRAVLCGCWDSELLIAAWRIPHWIARRFFGWTQPGTAAGYSTEPPF